ncbi:MAG: hypothetical protein ABI197_06965 [Granulicella sp.]
MAIPFLDTLVASRRRKAAQKRAALAETWPLATAEINTWKIQPAPEEPGAFSSNYQLEAAYHFTLNGDYYGGYLHSVPMTHHEAETLGQGSPYVNLRYNPANPDDNLALAADNTSNLPFKVDLS